MGSHLTGSRNPVKRDYVTTLSDGAVYIVAPRNVQVLKVADHSGQAADYGMEHSNMSAEHCHRA